MFSVMNYFNLHLVSEVMETWLRQQITEFFIKLDLCVPEKVHALFRHYPYI
jgi:hypothetical protein